MLNPTDVKYFKLAVSGPYKESEDDIAVKCPICGDSQKHRNNKRLHLFKKSDTEGVKCFNGGCPLEQIHSVSKFLKIFYPNLFTNYKLEVFNPNLELKIKKTETADWLSKPFENDTKNVDIKYTNLIDFNKLCQNLKSLSNEAFVFLRNRGLNANELQEKFGKFYSGNGKFLSNGRYYDLTDSLVIPINFRGKLCAFYARNIYEKRFVNANFLNIFVPWNYERVDLNKRVYIFEAILDALSFYTLYGETNIIALCTNTINSKILETIKEPYFCLDNDKTGISSMQKYINNSNVLIYPDSLKYKDFNEMLQNNYKLDLKFETGFKANISLRKLL